uniref:Cnidarian restricted protein n=1 Tax=Clytia hemisphaerica TaxID=252671 RepID=A0A7M5V7B9_9CNID
DFALRRYNSVVLLLIETSVWTTDTGIGGATDTGIGGASDPGISGAPASTGPYFKMRNIAMRIIWFNKGTTIPSILLGASRSIFLFTFNRFKFKYTFSTEMHFFVRFIPLKPSQSFFRTYRQ